MHRFNVFKAFSSGSSRDAPVSIERGSRPYVPYASDEGRPEYHPSAYGPLRRHVLTKRPREYGQHPRAQVFTPIPSHRATVEDYDDSDAALSLASGEDGPHAFDSVRPPSPIPAVHREEQPSRLREVFSDSGSGYALDTRSDDESTMQERPHTPHTLSQNEALQHPMIHPIPIDPSIGTEDHTESVGEYRPEDARPSSWQNFSGPSPLPLRGRSPVSVPDSHIHGHDRTQAPAYGDGYYEDPRSMRHHSHTDETYYIIPNGTNVIFQDEDGNEITRVGDFGPGNSHRRTRRPAPLIIQDEYGHELYRTGDYDGASQSSRSSDQSYHHVDPYERGVHGRSRSNHSHHRSPPVGYVDHRGREIPPNLGPGSDQSYSSYPTSSPNYILIDHRGRQIPLNPSNGSTSSRSGSHRSGRSSRPYH